MIILYGSQTGTAEDYASRLGREAKQYGFEPLLADFENFSFVRSFFHMSFVAEWALTCHRACREA